MREKRAYANQRHDEGIETGGCHAKVFEVMTSHDHTQLSGLAATLPPDLCNTFLPLSNLEPIQPNGLSGRGWGSGLGAGLGLEF